MSDRLLSDVRTRLKEFDYPNGDHLELNVQFNNLCCQWEASLKSIQRRGFVDYVGCVGRTYYADTPLEAANMAVAHAPKDWGYEPDKVRIVSCGKGAGYHMTGVPMQREIQP